ncbi:hypothetical protein LTR10_009173 [Elasticomyces elasticus]|nr:hypothetical protein LTR10_009173 [Elasticomyces elasticus]KAK4971725.1 hypothetical protein LTR42_007453 [Elasticomyces elasticus]
MENSLFMRLPTELRVQIYDLVLRQPEPIVIRWCFVRRWYSFWIWCYLAIGSTLGNHHPTALTATCRFIKQECGQSFYNINSFVLLCRNDVSWNNKLQLLRLFLERIGEPNRLALRSVAVDLGAYSDEWSDLQTVALPFQILGDHQRQIRVFILKMCFLSTWPAGRFELELPARCMKYDIKEQLDKAWARLNSEEELDEEDHGVGDIDALLKAALAWRRCWPRRVWDRPSFWESG